MVVANKNKKSSNPLGDDDSDDDFDPLSAMANAAPKPNISTVTTTTTASAPAKVCEFANHEMRLLFDLKIMSAEEQ